MFILLRTFYIACFNNDYFGLRMDHHKFGHILVMRQPYSVQCTMYKGYVFNEISCTSIKFPFKMFAILGVLRSYII